MDEEELEQPEQSENKISVEKFFTRLEAVDAVANDAMEKAESSSVIIESQAKTIESLTQTIETLKADVKNLSDIINVRDKQDRDAEADRLLEEEDRAQKEEMEARALAVQEQGESQGEQGQVEEEDREKGLLERIGDFFTDFLGGIVGAVGGLLLKSIGGIMLLGQKLIKGTKRGIGGVLDTLTLGLTDFDKRGGGGLNIFRRNREGELNEDGSKNLNYDPLAESSVGTAQAFLERVNPIAGIMGKVTRSQARKRRDKKVAKDQASSEYDETFFYEGDDTGREEFIEENVTAFAQGGPVFDNDEDKTNNDEDSVPAMLTPGEFIISKDAVKKIGIDTLKRINSAAGSTSQPTVKRISKFDQGGSVLGSFSIQKLDPNDLSKDALIKKSSFANDIETVEISNESGSDYFKQTTDMSTGGLSETTVKRTRFTETSEDGTVTVFDKETTMTEKIASIGVPDLIEHQDQLLGEIHKIKGFENVTIGDVINETTGIPQKTLLPILIRSDAQRATDKKERKATEEDRKARGIKPGEGFSMSASDEVARSLAGTMGYRIGQIRPDMLVSTMTDLKEETKVVTKTGVEPKIDPLFADLSESINASVKGYNEGGYVTKSSGTARGGKVISGDMSQTDYDIYKAEEELDIQREIHGYDSPEANEVQKRILILNGFPEEAIYTDKEGRLQLKGFHKSIDGKTTVEDNRRGLFGVLGGVADTLTGNITDFDRRGGGIMGGSLIDALTLNLTDFDRKGGKPAGPMRMATGLIDAASGGLFDLDRRGGKPSGLMRGITGAIDHMSGNVLDLDRRGGEMKGLPRLIAGGLDRMTGNVTDFDRKGGEQFGLPRAAMGILDAVTGDEFDFDQKGSDMNLGEVVSGEKKGLIENITDFMFRSESKTQKLALAQSAQSPITMDPASSPLQSEPGAAVMPAQPPQVMGTKIEPTAPNIPFIALLRGNAKRYMQDSSTGSDLASYLS